MPKSSDLLPGTLDLLVLRALELGPMHGMGVSDRIQQVTRGVFQVKPGSLFPALHRLERNGWLQGNWGESKNNRRAKFYSLTRTGRARLAAEKKNWITVFGAVNRLLEGEL
jgi:transcriptional regulator